MLRVLKVMQSIAQLYTGNQCVDGLCSKVWCFMGFEPVQECPTPLDKVLVLEEMIFPQCEKLGQTIIFVRTREIARTLHAAVRLHPSL